MNCVLFYSDDDSVFLLSKLSNISIYFVNCYQKYLEAIKKTLFKALNCHRLSLKVHQIFVLSVHYEMNQ